MNFLIIFNPDSNQAKEISNRAKEILTDCNASVNISEFDRSEEYDKSLNTLLKDTDAVIVIGGDGTILRIAKAAALHNCPILGINAGHLGYLASLKDSNIELLNQLVLNKYTVENRAMLKIEKLVNGYTVESCEALNDAVIYKDPMCNILDIVLNIGNDKIKYRADGIIVATPTGSTAYSLSAGGPVVDPQMKCLVITPVCPHTLVTRSLVTDGNAPITIKATNRSKESIFLSADGKNVFSIEENSQISVTISDNFAKFIKLNDLSVYKILSEKTDNY